jgi:hypothetical protein
MAKNTAVFAIFHSRANVDRAVDALKSAGFRNTDISVLFSDNEGTKDFAHEKQTKAPEGATTGGATGAVLGGTLGWLVGVGSLAIPGIGPFVAAGPIMAALAGAGVGGAIGGITGALVGMGIPEYEAKRYEGLVKDGGILVSVHCDDSNWTKLAKDIFAAEKGEGIAATSESGDIIEGTATDKPLHKGVGSHLGSDTMGTGSSSTTSRQDLDDRLSRPNTLL